MTESSMNAWTIDGYGGGTDSFQLTQCPRPQPGAGEVLVRVHASSYNPIDSKIRDGSVKIAPPFPAILNGDVAGVIATVGSGVQSFQEGDAVYGCCGGFFGHQGALAEYVVVRADMVAKAPQNLSLKEAASLPIASITAWYALVDKVQIQPGQNVLVMGGTGGVGHIGVQLAVSLGAKVYAACGTDEKCALAEKLGAVATYNYRSTQLSDVVQEHTQGAGFDVVFDTAGGASLANALNAVKFGGQVVTIAARGTHDLTPGHGRGISLHMVMMLDAFVTGQGLEHYGEILQKISELVSDGAMHPVLDDKDFTFDRVGEAHDYAALAQHTGKIALSYPPSSGGNPAGGTPQ